MKRLNVSKELIESLLDGGKAKKFSNWKNFYNILKTFGIVGSVVALMHFGITIPFFVTSVSIMVVLAGVYTEELVPARKAKEAEDIEKMDFILKLQQNNAKLINARGFVLDRTDSVNYREVVTYNETKFLRDGSTIEDNLSLKKFYGEGLEKDIIVATDGIVDKLSNRKRIIAYLAVVREYVLAQKEVVDGCGYMIVPEVSNSYVELLDDLDAENLTPDVKKKVKEVITGSNKK